MTKPNYVGRISFRCLESISERAQDLADTYDLGESDVCREVFKRGLRSYETYLHNERKRLAKDTTVE